MTEKLHIAPEQFHFDPSLLPSPLRKPAKAALDTHTAAKQAIARHNDLTNQSHDVAARRDDEAALQASAPAPGKPFTDPGTPAVADLAERRASVHREAVARLAAFNDRFAEYAAACEAWLAGRVDDARGPSAPDLAAKVKALLPLAEQADAETRQVQWVYGSLGQRSVNGRMLAHPEPGAATAALSACLAAVEQPRPVVQPIPYGKPGWGSQGY